MEMRGLALRILAAVFLAFLLYSAVSQLPQPAQRLEPQRDGPQVAKAETEAMTVEGGAMAGERWSPYLFAVNLGLSLALGLAAALIISMRQR